MREVTQSILKSLLHYDESTGGFVWLSPPSRVVKAGDKAGTISSQGYVKIAIYRRSYRAHRLAWLYVHGRWPENEIDHIDGVRSNNSISNLREATHAENMQNYRKPVTNRTGFKGVYRAPKSKKWSAYIQVSRRRIHIGQFDSPELAAQAYAQAAAKYCGQFARAC